MSSTNKFKIPVLRMTKRQALENSLQPIPNETKGDPDIHKKWKAIWESEEELTYWAKKLRKEGNNGK